MALSFELVPAPLGPITLEQHEWEQHEKCRAANLRPHCCKCGRFLRKATLRTVGSYWSDDWETTGTCPVHGPGVYVSWERA